MSVTRKIEFFLMLGFTFCEIYMKSFKLERPITFLTNLHSSYIAQLPDLSFKAQKTSYRKNKLGKISNRTGKQSKLQFVFDIFRGLDLKI